MISSFFTKVYNRLTNNSTYLFAALWCVIGLLCLPAYKAGFNGDFEGLIGHYKTTGFWDFVQGKNFSVKSMYQLTQLQLYTLLSVFGTHRIPWFILLTALHALNATFAFVFCKRLFSDFLLPKATAIAFTTALLFAFNPNITEVTIWKGGYHYLTGVLAQLAILLWTLQFLKTQHKKYAVYVAVVYLLSSFTLEIFYLTPWFCLFLALAYRWKNLISKKIFDSAIVSIFLPQIALFLFHLLCFRLRFGTWIAHYGTTGEFFFTGEKYLPKLPKYLSTLLLFSGHYTISFAQWFYAFFNKPSVYTACYIIALLFTAFIFIRFRKLNPAAQAASLFFGMMMLCVGIISPMFFDEVMQIYNSRRCYELSFPVYALLSIAAFSILPQKNFALFFFLVCISLFGIFSLKKAMDWRQANKIQMALLRNFKWQKENNVLILNMPSYYKDIRVIPTSRWDEFQENLHVFGYDTSQNKMQYVSAYNMIGKWDGAHVTMEDSSTVKVVLNQWGSWWMYDMVGALDFENESYRLEMKDVGHQYLLHLKKPAKEYTILYQQGENWKQVDVTKKAGEEQW